MATPPPRRGRGVPGETGFVREQLLRLDAEQPKTRGQAPFIALAVQLRGGVAGARRLEQPSNGLGSGSDKDGHERNLPEEREQSDSLVVVRKAARST